MLQPATRVYSIAEHLTITLIVLSNEARRAYFPISKYDTALSFCRRWLRGEHEDPAVVPEVPLRPLPRGGDEERGRHARRREATALQEEHPQEAARRTGTDEKKIKLRMKCLSLKVEALHGMSCTEMGLKGCKYIVG